MSIKAEGGSRLRIEKKRGVYLHVREVRGEVKHDGRGEWKRIDENQKSTVVWVQIDAANKRIFHFEGARDSEVLFVFPTAVIKAVLSGS